jgi:hypothetical protein
MIVSIWVFMVLGVQEDQGTAYVQHTASAHQHDYAPEKVERETCIEFEEKYPGHVVAESGWHRQSVKVMGDE